MAFHIMLPMPDYEFASDFAKPEFQADWLLAQQFIQDAKDGVNGATFRVMSGTLLRADRGTDRGTGHL